jgi:hypothetical protein
LEGYPHASKAAPAIRKDDFITSFHIKSRLVGKLLASRSNILQPQPELATVSGDNLEHSKSIPAF